MERWRHWERGVAMVDGAGFYEAELKRCQRHIRNSKVIRSKGEGVQEVGKG